MIILQFAGVMTDVQTSIADCNISTSSRMWWGLVPKREATKVKRKWFSYQRSNANAQQSTTRKTENTTNVFLYLFFLLMHQGDSHRAPPSNWNWTLWGGGFQVMQSTLWVQIICCLAVDSHAVVVSSLPDWNGPNNKFCSHARLVLRLHPLSFSVFSAQAPLFIPFVIKHWLTELGMGRSGEEG